MQDIRQDYITRTIHTLTGNLKLTNFRNNGETRVIPFNVNITARTRNVLHSYLEDKFASTNETLVSYEVTSDTSKVYKMPVAEFIKLAV